jgi:hypothetical protein
MKIGTKTHDRKNTTIPFVPLCLCIFVPFFLCAYVPLSLCAFSLLTACPISTKGLIMMCSSLLKGR